MKKILSYLSIGCLAMCGCNQPASSTTSQATSGAQAKPGASSLVTSAPVLEQAEVQVPAGKLVSADPKLATLKAKFVYGGKAPEPAKIDGSKDSFCANLDIRSESMLIGKEGQIKNLALYMDAKRSKVDVPEAMKAAPAVKIDLDNKGCVFVPHVLIARPGQTINVLNSDGTGHNANFAFFNNEAVNFLVPAGGSKGLMLTADEPAPIPVECNVHSWMRAHIIIQDHPYVGVTDDNGELTIENLPLGEVTFRVWHENSEGSIDEVKVDGKPQSWSKGRMEIELQAGVNDLGTIVIAPEKFRQ